VFGDHPVCSRCGDMTLSAARDASVADTLVERQTLVVSEPPRLRLNDSSAASPIHAEVHLSGPHQVRRFTIGDSVEVVGILQCYSPQDGKQQVYLDCQYAHSKSLSQLSVSKEFVREMRANQPTVSGIQQALHPATATPGMREVCTLPLTCICACANYMSN